MQINNFIRFSESIKTHEDNIVISYATIHTSRSPEDTGNIGQFIGDIINK